MTKTIAEIKAAQYNADRIEDYVGKHIEISTVEFPAKLRADAKDQTLLTVIAVDGETQNPPRKIFTISGPVYETAKLIQPTLKREHVMGVVNQVKNYFTLS